MTLSEILKDSNYKLTQFSEGKIKSLEEKNSKNHQGQRSPLCHLPYPEARNKTHSRRSHPPALCNGSYR